MLNLIQILDACTEPSILKVILFIKTLLRVVLFIVPMGLIIMVSVDFGKNIIAQNTDDMKKNLQLAIKRILYCVVLFLVPTIVEATMSMFDKFGLDYAACISNAESVTIKSFELSKAQDAIAKLETNKTEENLIAAENAVSQITDESTKKTYKEKISPIRKEIEEKVKQEQNNNINKVPDYNVTGSSEQGSSSGSSSADKASKGEGLWVAHQKNNAKAIDDAINEGFWGIEVDVHQDSSTFKLYHDAENEPYAGYNLDEFLDTCKEKNITAVLDIKSIKNYETLVTLVKDKGMQNKTIYQVGHYSVKKIHDIDGNARIWILLDHDTDLDSTTLNNIKKVKDYVEGINMYAKKVDENDVKTIQDLGLTICAFSYIDKMYSDRSSELLKSWGTNYLMANNIGG